jgi:hypothetical protein
MVSIKKKLLQIILIAMFLGVSISSGFSQIAKIKKITVTKFPPRDGNGKSWDSFSGLADVYYTVIQGNRFLLNGKPQKKENADPNSKITWDLGVNVICNQRLSITLYDDDNSDLGDSDDYIGGIDYFIPSKKGVNLKIEGLVGLIYMEIIYDVR